jgi:hypothetical protein
MYRGGMGQKGVAGLATPYVLQVLHSLVRQLQLLVLLVLLLRLSGDDTVLTQHVHTCTTAQWQSNAE